MKSEETKTTAGETYGVAIVGTRTFGETKSQRRLFTKTLNDFFDSDDFGKGSKGKKVIIVSGGARGADSLARRYAKKYELELVEHLPQWDRYGKAAGPLRNTLIINAADIVFAFWDGRSPGTRDTINQAISKGKRVITITF
jgi:hypothetical protein